MPDFNEKHYTLDLKKSADFGPDKEVYTLTCRQISYGSEKDSHNYILTPGGTQKNFTQLNALKNLLAGNNILLYSFDSLRRFFDPAEFAQFQNAAIRNSIEIKLLAKIFMLDDNLGSMEELSDSLLDLYGQSVAKQLNSAEGCVAVLARLIASFEHKVVQNVSRLLSTSYQLLSGWLAELTPRESGLPVKFSARFPEHFIKFKSTGSSTDSPDEAERLKEIFSGQGRLAQIIPDYESRREQLHMAELYHRTLHNQEYFVAEAGTGTGKSLAYLIPAIYHLYDNDQRAIFTTYTKALQNQLFFNDLQLAARACERDFSAALLKGRANYLCLLKKAMISSSLSRAVKPEDYYDLARVEVWKTVTQSGDLSEINLNNREVQRDVSAEASFCLRQSCQFYSECHFYKARKNAAKSVVVVANQALFFSDLLADGSVLGKREVLVFDEAHRLEKTATDYLGGRLERFRTVAVLNGLFNKKDDSDSSLNSAEYIYNDSLTDKKKDFDFGNIRKQTDRAKSLIDDIFRQMKSYQTARNYRADTFTFKKRFDSGSDFFFEIGSILESLQSVCERLNSGLLNLQSFFAGQDYDQDKLIRLEAFNRSVSEIQYLKQIVDIFTQCDSAKYIFWQELSQQDYGSLCFAPLDVGPELERLIYRNYPCIMFTSASLSVEGFFEYYERSVGLNLLPNELIVRKSFGSSFDFYHQIDFYCPVYLPSPKMDYYSSSLVKFINFIVPALNKKTLILFTSYQLLSEIYYNTGNKLTSLGFEVFAQALSGSAESILRSFKQSRRAVLFGTDSFWEGVDLPGDFLELLIITRLPFATPADPIDSARMERLETEGENAFVTYSIPNAVLKFKQGFGRLIRHKSDTGTIIVTDNRLVKSRYGQFFLNSVPAELNIVSSADEFIEKISR